MVHFLAHLQLLVGGAKQRRQLLQLIAIALRCSDRKHRLQILPHNIRVPAFEALLEGGNKILKSAQNSQSEIGLLQWQNCRVVRLVL